MIFSSLLAADMWDDNPAQPVFVSGRAPAHFPALFMILSAGSPCVGFESGTFHVARSHRISILDTLSMELPSPRIQHLYVKVVPRSSLCAAMHLPHIRASFLFLIMYISATKDCTLPSHFPIVLVSRDICAHFWIRRRVHRWPVSNPPGHTQDSPDGTWMTTTAAEKLLAARAGISPL